MIAAIILTKNESTNIRKCLMSVQFCDEILVVDDQSTDDTAKIAKAHGAKVVEHSLSGNFSRQRNWAMSQVKSDWVLFIDADEIVSENLANEIKTSIKSDTYDGYYLHRIDTLWNKQLEHGDVSNVYVLRLGKKEKGQWVGVVHESWQNLNKTCRLTHPLNHYPHQSVVEFLEHINKYSSLKAAEFKQQKRNINVTHIVFAPIWRLVKNYIFKQGFKDGMPGLISAMMMSMYVFLTASKTYMMQKTPNGSNN